MQRWHEHAEVLGHVPWRHPVGQQLLGCLDFAIGHQAHAPASTEPKTRRVSPCIAEVPTRCGRLGS